MDHLKRRRSSETNGASNDLRLEFFRHFMKQHHVRRCFNVEPRPHVARVKQENGVFSFGKFAEDFGDAGLASPHCL